MCLEEMLDVEITTGAIYHIQSKKRHEFTIDYALRQKTLHAIEEIRHNLVNNILPKAEYSKRKCDNCSLYDFCLPKIKEPKTLNSIFKPVEFNG